jgi:Lrp/AsnC family transcriptional regulator for asnA, asnC and gidA
VCGTEIVEESRSLDSLDNTDRRIVMVLQEDGTMPRAEVGRRVGLSEAAVRKRVERLLHEGVIRIVAIPDPKKVGLNTIAIIGIRVTPGRATQVVEKLMALKSVRWVGYTTGEYDVIVEVMLSTPQQLLKYLNDDIGAIDGINATETSIVLEIAKRTYAVLHDEESDAKVRVRGAA